MQVSELILYFLLYICTASVYGILINDNDEAYYWRDYTGDIPSDALPGGSDKLGNTMYIGQTRYEGFVGEIPIPGKIDAVEKKMSFEWGYEEHIAKENIKILCTHHPERFEWIKTNTTEIKNIPEGQLVPGGYEQDYGVYIGRVATKGEVSVGKVLVTYKPIAGLQTTIDGKWAQFTTFEVLAYNSDN